MIPHAKRCKGTEDHYDRPMGQTSKELDTRIASVLLLILQICCWGGFFTAEYGLFDPAEYEMYIGIALMMLIGFGYLMTFLKAYGLGAVGFTFIITCLSVQMNMFLAALIPNNNKLVVDSVTLTDGNFAAATVLIRYAIPRALTPPSRGLRCQLATRHIRRTLVNAHAPPVRLRLSLQQLWVHPRQIHTSAARCAHDFGVDLLPGARHCPRKQAV